MASYDPAATPNKVKIAWQHEQDLIQGRMAWVGGSLSDLDQDGQLEVVVAEYDGSTWATKIYDARTGDAIVAIPSSTLAGIEDLDGNGTREVLTYALPGSDLTASSFKRTTPSKVATLWKMTHKETVPVQQDWTRTRTSSNDTRVLAIDLDADKALDLVLYVPADSSAGTPASLTVYTTASNNPKALASYAVPEGLSLLTHDVFSQVNRPYDQLLVTRSDGYLAILDNELKPTNLVEDPEVTIPGMRVGGYYSGPHGFGNVPIAPRLDGAADAVLARDSRGTLLRLDPQGASLVSPPAPTPTTCKARCGPARTTAPTPSAPAPPAPPSAPSGSSPPCATPASSASPP